MARPRRPVVRGLLFDDERLLRDARRDAILAMARRRASVRVDRALARGLGFKGRKAMLAEVDRLIDDGEPLSRIDEFVHLASGGRTRVTLDLGDDGLTAVLVGLRRLAEGGPDRQLMVEAAHVLHRIAADLPLRDFRRLRGLGGFDLPPAAEAPPGHAAPDQRARAVQAMEAWTKLRFTYTDSGGTRTARTVWPVRLTHGEMCLVGWCEERNDFRTFRLDRMAAVAPLDEAPPRSREALLAEWRAAVPERERAEDHPGD